MRNTMTVLTILNIQNRRSQWNLSVNNATQRARRECTHAHLDTYSQWKTGARKIKTIKPTRWPKLPIPFPIQFQLDILQLRTWSKQVVGTILVKFHHIFARHRSDIGINTVFKVKLTPLDNRPAYNQSLPATTNLEDDILVELALQHYYGIFSTLRQFDTRTKETLWETTTIGWPPKNKHTHSRRLH